MTVKFLPGAYTGFTVEDESPETSLDMGTFFYNETRETSFRLGNDDSTTKNYQVIASGLNTEITDVVQFSTDKITYSDSVTIAGLIPNEVSDVIYCKLDCPEFIASGDATFLIHIDEV